MSHRRTNALPASGSGAPRRAWGLSPQMTLLAAIVCLPLLVLNGIHMVEARHQLVTDAGIRARTLVDIAAKLHADATPDEPTRLRLDRGAVWSTVARMAAADRMDIMLLDGRDDRVLEARLANAPNALSLPSGDEIRAAVASGAPRQVNGLDDRSQIIAAVALPGTQVLVAGIAMDRLLADAHRRLLVTLAGMVAAAAGVLGAVWLVARWSLVRPLGVMISAVQRFRGGDLTMRVVPGHLWAPELAELAAVLNDAAQRLERSHQLLSDRANRDGLTSLATRRCFDERLATEWRRARRSNHSMSILMVDVDEFKAYNDRYGHVMGDECLRQIAGALQTCLRRPSDEAARYGGEEFVILLPETDLTGAIFVASRMLEVVRALSIVHRARPDGLMTVSIGVASAIPGDADEPVPCLLTVADEALYAAKRQGRARFVVAESQEALLCRVGDAPSAR